MGCFCIRGERPEKKLQVKPREREGGKELDKQSQDLGWSLEGALRALGHWGGQALRKAEPSGGGAIRGLVCLRGGLMRRVGNCEGGGLGRILEESWKWAKEDK